MKKMTKQERIAREADLADTMFHSLATVVREHALAWSRRAKKLAEGLSAAAIRRAQKRATAMADDVPPGHLRALEAMDTFDDLCREYQVPKRDGDIMWGSVSQVCMHQLAARRGPFYQAAVDFGLVREPEKPVPIATVLDRVFAGRDGNAVCDCPNCRPRKPEELN